jgi:hypothetical protein
MKPNIHFLFLFHIILKIIGEEGETVNKQLKNNPKFSKVLSSFVNMSFRLVRNPSGVRDGGRIPPLLARGVHGSTSSP